MRELAAWFHAIRPIALDEKYVAAMDAARKFGVPLCGVRQMKRKNISAIEELGDDKPQKGLDQANDSGLSNFRERKSGLRAARKFPVVAAR